MAGSDLPLPNHFLAQVDLPKAVIKWPMTEAGASQLLPGAVHSSKGQEKVEENGS